VHTILSNDLATSNFGSPEQPYMPTEHDLPIDMGHVCERYHSTRHSELKLGSKSKSKSKSRFFWLSFLSKVQWSRIAILLTYKAMYHESLLTLHGNNKFEFHDAYNIGIFFRKTGPGRQFIKYLVILSLIFENSVLFDYLIPCTSLQKLNLDRGFLSRYVLAINERTYVRAMNLAKMVKKQRIHIPGLVAGAYLKLR
jgi:hypothetical protein